MEAYEPLDLSAHCNAGISLLEDEKIPLGCQTLHGLPFQIGPAQPRADSCLLSFGPDAAAEMEIAVGAQAQRIVFAHRLLESRIMEGGPIGEQAGEYVFDLKGGEEVRVPLRERFEISTAPPGRATPFLAFADHGDKVLPRYEGAWEQAGRRQTEGAAGGARWFVLWVWKNPQPDKPVERITVRAAMLAGPSLSAPSPSVTPTRTRSVAKGCGM